MKRQKVEHPHRKFKFKIIRTEENAKTIKHLATLNKV
jgi:hypothetical protein